MDGLVSNPERLVIFTVQGILSIYLNTTSQKRLYLPFSISYRSCIDVCMYYTKLNAPEIQHSRVIQLQVASLTRIANTIIHNIIDQTYAPMLIQLKLRSDLNQTSSLNRYFTEHTYKYSDNNRAVDSRFRTTNILAVIFPSYETAEGEALYYARTRPGALHNIMQMYADLDLHA